MAHSFGDPAFQSRWAPWPCPAVQLLARRMCHFWWPILVVELLLFAFALELLSVPWRAMAKATGFCRSSCDCLIGFGVCKCIRVQLVVPIWFTMIHCFFPRLQGFLTWLPKQVSLNGTFSRHYSWEKCIWPEVKPSLNTVADLQHVSWCRNHSSWKGKVNYQVKGQLVLWFWWFPGNPIQTINHYFFPGDVLQWALTTCTWTNSRLENIWAPYTLKLHWV